MNNKKSALLFFILLIILLVVLSGCQPLPQANAAAHTPQVVLVTRDPNAPPTPTPFQPLAATPTVSGPIFPTATPIETPQTEKDDNDNDSGGTYYDDSGVELIKQPENQINILLLGSDQRPYEGGFRTDVILLVTVNKDLKTINMTSFPRDLYVYLPGLYNDRINSAQFRGGFSMMSDTLAYNFGVRPDYYALVNFSGFKQIINTLGGIDVQVAYTLSDHRDGYGTYTVSAGTRHMDADTALWYVRSRKTTSDFDRTRRQQEVIQAIMNKMLSFDVITKAPELYKQFNATVETNLPLSEITPLLPLASDFINGNIGRYAVGPNHVSNWVTPGGSQVLLPNKYAIREMLKSALNATE